MIEVTPNGNRKQLPFLRSSEEIDKALGASSRLSIVPMRRMSEFYAIAHCSDGQQFKNELGTAALGYDVYGKIIGMTAAEYRRVRDA